MQKERHYVFNWNVLLILAGVLMMAFLIISTSGEAGYDQHLTDNLDDVWDREQETTTDQHPEIDVKSVVTSNSRGAEVDLTITYKGDIAVEGDYMYQFEVSDGEEESEHTAILYFAPNWEMNRIDYTDGENEESVYEAVSVDGDTLTAVIDIDKCNIPAESFTIEYALGALLEGEWKFGDDCPDGSMGMDGEGTAEEGYMTTVEVVADDGDEHENDIKVTVEYDDGESRAVTPVEGANVTVSVLMESYEDKLQGFTDENGEITFKNFVPGEFVVTVYDDQYGEYVEMFMVEVLMEGKKILKVDADPTNLDRDDVEDDARVYVYYGTMMAREFVSGADVYFDGELHGQTGSTLYGIEGPLAEGHHLIKVVNGDDIAYDDFRTWYFNDGTHEEEVEYELRDDDGDGKVNDLDLRFEEESGPQNPISGVDVYLDGGKIGTTDGNGEVYHKDITDGYHEITLTYDGDDYFEYLLIGITEEHEIGDFNFDGNEDDMKFDVTIGGYPLPYSLLGYSSNARDEEEVIGGGYTNFDGTGYVQGIPGGEYSTLVMNIAFHYFNQSTGFDFSMEGGALKNMVITTNLPDFIQSEETVPMEITITGSPGIEGVDVTLETTGPGRTCKSHATTDEKGEVLCALTAHNVTGEDAVVTVYINGTKDGHNNGYYMKQVTIKGWYKWMKITSDLPDSMNSQEVRSMKIRVSGDEGPIEAVYVKLHAEGDGHTCKSGGSTNSLGEVDCALTAAYVSGENGSVILYFNATKPGYENAYYTKTVIIIAKTSTQPEKVIPPIEVSLGNNITGEVSAGIVGSGSIQVQSKDAPDTGDEDALGVYINITQTGTGTLNWVFIKIEYTDVPAGIDPAKLRMYYWDETNSKWVKITTSGVNTDEKYIWANVTHLTIFAPRQTEEDDVPPMIIHTAVKETEKEEKITISAVITDQGDGVQSATLYYRQKGASTYTDVAMAKNGESYSADIPGDKVTKDMEYYIEATDGTNVVTSPSDTSQPYVVELEEDEDDDKIIPGFEIALLIGMLGLSAYFVSRKRE